jgi:signal transduction histidine kinase
LSGGKRHAGAITPVRVLSVGGGRGLADLSDALAGQGHEVQFCPDPSTLPDEARLAGFDAIVLDLTSEGISDDAASRLATTLGRPDRDDPPLPIVLGVTVDGKAPTGRSVRADVWIDSERAMQEVEGALAIRRLEVADREIEDLRRTVLHARRMAHDLAQPLTTVLARSQLLLRNVQPEDPNYRAVAIICREADRLAQLVEQFQTLKEMAKQTGEAGG